MRPSRWLDHALLDLVVVAAFGAAQTLSYVDSRAWPLQLLAIAWLAWRVGQATPLRAAALGWAFGCAWLLAGTWWLYISMHRYGGLPAWMTALAVFALAALLSLYLAGAMAWVARGRGFGRTRNALLFAAVWLLAELARGVVFTGFPWVASGYAHVDSPLAGYAPVLGVYGIGAMAAALAAGFGSGDALRRGGWIAPALALAVVLGGGVALSRLDFTQPTTRLVVALVQGNVPQEEKFATRYVPDALAATVQRLRAARGDLVVAPETVIPVLPAQVDPTVWNALIGHFKEPGRAALFGAPMGDDATGYTNSALGVSPETRGLPGGVYRYDKHHLVPFGEFIPTGFRWFTRLMNIPLGDFNRGPLTSPSFQVGAERVAPNICYEDLFGEELAARFLPASAAPTMLANISNIGWFGETIAVEQHLRISRMRSLELQRPMIRATNTGATAVIDHHGVVTASLKPFTAGVLEASVEGRDGLTPFVQWSSRFGVWPLWGLGFAAAWLLAKKRRP